MRQPPPLDPAHAVRLDSLLPAEVPTPIDLLRQADCYEQCGVKYPLRGTFHSYAELLHFALCEGDPLVTTFIPQPYRMRIDGKPYIPDAYLVRGGERIVVELKPHGEFDDAKRVPLEAFFRFHGMRFVVVSNDSMLAREIEALNWLEVVRTLASAVDIDTSRAELELWQTFADEPHWALGDLLDAGDRQQGFVRELALWRLLHRGKLRAHWELDCLSPDTVFERCA